MGRSLISAYYKFQLIKEEFGIIKLKPLFRYLNEDSFNLIFESPDACKISVIGPCPEVNGYICYSFKFKDYDQNDGMILLSTSAGLLPLGVGRALESNDCFIWRMTEENIFEVFVCMGMCDQSYQLLSSVQDGTGGTREEIDWLFERIEALDIEND
ncbi:hypothetical protein SAMN05421813_101280 [Daejeonella rubra]|uniref:Uncharacterized protein n=1 Tax=Daejeonella rubra TaxID=990371 RepID=A0A1G9M897_9SPHI|nr:hypothetical protein [Daejeonella rubra]SDL70333.1 hypothetical protein SAMN05421813_101280 [Daejeonella rubra]